jgi:hypothetical protein
MDLTTDLTRRWIVDGYHRQEESLMRIAPSRLAEPSRALTGRRGNRGPGQQPTSLGHPW